MTKTTVSTKTIVVVADGEHAQIFRNVGNGEIKLEPLKIDMVSGEGHRAGASPTEMSPGEMDEANFTAKLAASLYAQFHNAQHDYFLVADPQTLGELRKSLHTELLSKVSGELNKNLTKSSLKELTAALEATTK